MKTLKLLFVTCTVFVMITSLTSCLILLPTDHHDHGKHKGWDKKKSNQPTIIIHNDDHHKGKSHGKGKGKKH